MAYYPPLGFYFKVSFEANVLEPAPEDMDFQSVSGLSSEVVTETFKEGGQNEFEYELPVKMQYPDLVLKRGLWVPKGRAGGQNLQGWFEQMMGKLQVQPATLYVHLMNPSKKEEALMSWKVVGAWPKKWSVSDFNAEQNEVVIESMEFSYLFFKVM